MDTAARRAGFHRSARRGTRSSRTPLRSCSSRRSDRAAACRVPGGVGERIYGRALRGQSRFRGLAPRADPRQIPHMASNPTARIHAALAPARARLGARDAAILRSQVAVSEIAAPTGSEGLRGAWVASRFSGLGLADVHQDAAGNVIGWRGVAAGVAPVVV